MKSLFFKVITSTIIVSSISMFAQAQEEDDIFSMSLEDLMNVEISVGSANKLSLRETPGIVTVITSEEIENSGARDLVDVLRLVPGFEFSGELENTVGLGIRGNYALEGKALVLVDGQQMNENGYGTVIFGNRFQTDNISKIEIIRGPGSAVYGGLAELAVINIITKSGSELSGGYASAQYGTSNGSTSRIATQFGAGTTLSNNLKISLTGSYSAANRSNESVDYATNILDIEDGAPATFNYADSSEVKNINLNLGIEYNGIQFKAIYQDYKIQGNAGGADYLIQGGLYLGAKYSWELGEKLTFIPELSWKKEAPWSYEGNLNDNYLTNYVADSYRTRGNLTGLYKPTDNISITFGGEYYFDKAVKPDGKTYNNGENTVDYNNKAVFAEVLFKSSFANFILGARYDDHSGFGDAFVPRFSVTRAWDKFHVKGLLSRAFKAPQIYNFEADPNIKAEFTNVAEVEVGYLLTENMSLTGNLFYVKIENPIIYFYEGTTDSDSYLNYEQASTVGIELDYRIKYDWGYINSTYSYYKNQNTKAEPYEIPEDDKLLRGFPAHKVTMTAAINLNEKFTISPTVIYNSKKIGYFAQEEFWEGDDFYTYDPNLILNLNLIYRATDIIQFNLSVYDLFDQQYLPANAYDAWYAGTPMMGREIAIKAKVKF